MSGAAERSGTTGPAQDLAAGAGETAPLNDKENFEGRPHRQAVHDYFGQCVKEWAAADEHCRRAYAIWQDACERRKRIAAKKNEAWRELSGDPAAGRQL